MRNCAEKLAEDRRLYYEWVYRLALGRGDSPEQAKAYAERQLAVQERIRERLAKRRGR